MSNGYVCLFLPFPPTTNNLFAGKARRFPSKAYKAWKEEAAMALMQQQPLMQFSVPVKLTIGLARPDKRRRDPSNYIKAPEDFLVNPAEILSDDSQVHDVRAYWAHDVDSGCRLEIEVLP